MGRPFAAHSRAAQPARADRSEVGAGGAAANRLAATVPARQSGRADGCRTSKRCNNSRRNSRLCSSRRRNSRLSCNSRPSNTRFSSWRWNSRRCNRRFTGTAPQRAPTVEAAAPLENLSSQIRGRRLRPDASDPADRPARMRAARVGIGAGRVPHASRSPGGGRRTLSRRARRRSIERSSGRGLRPDARQPAHGPHRRCRSRELRGAAIQRPRRRNAHRHRHAAYPARPSFRPYAER